MQKFQFNFIISAAFHSNRKVSSLTVLYSSCLPVPHRKYSPGYYSCTMQNTATAALYCTASIYLTQPATRKLVRKLIP